MYGIRWFSQFCVNLLYDKTLGKIRENERRVWKKKSERRRKMGKKTRSYGRWKGSCVRRIYTRVLVQWSARRVNANAPTRSRVECRLRRRAHHHEWESSSLLLARAMERERERKREVDGLWSAGSYRSPAGRRFVVVFRSSARVPSLLHTHIHRNTNIYREKIAPQLPANESRSTNGWR